MSKTGEYTITSYSVTDNDKMLQLKIGKLWFIVKLIIYLI